MNRMLMTVAVLVLPHVAQAQNGYKGITWGTPCAEAIQRLGELGTKFSSQGTRTTHFDNMLGQTTFMRGFRAFAPEGCPFIRNAGIPPLEVATGTADDLDVTVYCADGKFAAVVLGGDDLKVGKTLRAAAGAPQATKKKRINYPGTQRTATYSKLSARGDSVRFLEWTSAMPTQNYGTVPARLSYEVISAAVARDFTDAIKRCVDSEAAASRAARQKSEAARKSVVE